MKKILYISCLAFAVISCGDTSNKTEEMMQENQETPNAGPEKTTPEASAELRWMEKIADADWTDNSAPDHKLIFGKSTTQGGIVTGELEEHFPGLINLVKYESPSEGVLNIHLLKTIRDGVEEQRTHKSSLKLKLMDDGNTLVIDYPDGRTLRYARSKINASAKETIAETEEQKQARIWVETITAGEWKSDELRGVTYKFNKSTQEGSIIKGEYEGVLFGEIATVKYEKTPDGEMKCEVIKSGAYKGKKFSENMKLIDEGKTLIVTQRSKSYKFTY